MEGGVGEAVLLTLSMLIESIAGYPVPDTWPEIHRMPAPEIAERVCGAPCPIAAAYITGEGILIDEKLDLVMDAFGQSVLLHELVHAAQDENGAYREMLVCRRHTEREYEAYRVQDEYLRRVTGRGLPGLHRGNRVWPTCFDEKKGAAPE